MLPKIAWLCCTFRRPKLLGNLIDCFLKQEYPAERRMMLILDDDHEYEPREENGWRLISVPERYKTIGDKRNALASMVPEDVDILCPTDDDDLQMPHQMRAHAAALEKADLSVPSDLFWELHPGKLVPWKQTCHGSSWGYRREFFFRTGGYPPICYDGHGNGEDQVWINLVKAQNWTIANPMAFGFGPFYISRQYVSDYHLHLYDERTVWDDALQVPHAAKYEITIEPGYRMHQGVPVLIPQG